MPVVQASFKAKKVDNVRIPGDRTRYILAPDVGWNKSFQAICTEKYDNWLEKKEFIKRQMLGIWNLRRVVLA